MTRVYLGALALVAGGFLIAAENKSCRASLDGTEQQPKIPVPLVPAVPGTGDVDPQMPLFQTVAKACDDCARVCDTCSVHCGTLLAGGNKDHLQTMRLCQDCATVCSAAGRVIVKDGPVADLMCTACADACKRCGEACQKHAADPMMKKCADECFKCEKACRELLKGGAPPKGTAPPAK